MWELEVVLFLVLFSIGLVLFPTGFVPFPIGFVPFPIALVTFPIALVTFPTGFVPFPIGLVLFPTVICFSHLVSLTFQVGVSCLQSYPKNYCSKEGFFGHIKKIIVAKEGFF